MPLTALDRILRPLRLGPSRDAYPGTPPHVAPATRGLPELDPDRCDGRASCVEVCPTGAIGLTDAAWTLDAGACTFCGACARACPTGAIRLGPTIELAARLRADLVIERPRRSGS